MADQPLPGSVGDRHGAYEVIAIVNNGSEGHADTSTRGVVDRGPAL